MWYLRNTPNPFSFSTIYNILSNFNQYFAIFYFALFKYRSFFDLNLPFTRKRLRCFLLSTWMWQLFQTDDSSVYATSSKYLLYLICFPTFQLLLKMKHYICLKAICSKSTSMQKFMSVYNFRMLNTFRIIMSIINWFTK